MKKLVALFSIASFCYAGHAPHEEFKNDNYVMSFAKDEYGSFVSEHERHLLSHLVKTKDHNFLIEKELELLFLACATEHHRSVHHQKEEIAGKNVTTDYYWTLKHGSNCRHVMNFLKHKYKNFRTH